jgi:hypothetical protein
MVFFILRNFGHSIYEIDRIGKIIELKSALDVVLFQLPFRDLFHPVFQVRSFN